MGRASAAPASAAQPAPIASAAGATDLWAKWEPKDYLLGLGVLVTLALGIGNALANLHFNRRTTFVATVTSQRILWIEKLRQDISSFSGLVYHWAFTNLPDKPEEREILKEIDRLRHVIRLRLNPKGKYDAEIESLLPQVVWHTSDQEKVVALLEQLTVATQGLLKEEWEKVKAESKKGPLSERA